MHDDLQRLLDHAREIRGKAINLTSAYRCPVHNAAVGGSVDSAHVRQWAADIACESAAERWELVQIFLSLGVTRFGLAGDFLHVDIDPDKPPQVMWVYS